jgi:exonuclease III
LIVLCIYRVPTGNLKQFCNLLENTLNHFLQPNTTYLICGDLNINFSVRSKDTLKLETLMNTFNLTQVVDFPTRITNNNGTLIDTIFVDTSLCDKIQVKPHINGLSDHNAQLISLQNSMVGLQQYAPKRKTRIIIEQTIKHFQMLLNDETWYTVYKRKTRIINEQTIKHFQMLLNDET